jgi:hypothetical protein
VLHRGDCLEPKGVDGSVALCVTRSSPRWEVEGGLFIAGDLEKWLGDVLQRPAGFPRAFSSEVASSLVSMKHLKHLKYSALEALEGRDGRVRCGTSCDRPG